MIEFLSGDCVEKMREMEAGIVDAVVTDPPYGLEFMGKAWDRLENAPEWHREWAAEALRVLKPGGHLIAFGGTRTYHELATGIERAGFEIRDMLMWIHGQGFPKSRNIGKEVEGFDGWGTALKPAHEPICLARKPLDGTVARNVLKHGVGGINVDGCRVPGNVDEMRGRSGTAEVPGGDAVAYRAHNPDGGIWEPSDNGRWPANVIHDGSEEVLAGFPDVAPATSRSNRKDRSFRPGEDGQEGSAALERCAVYLDASRSAARFFYCAKPSQSEKNSGLDDAFETKQTMGGGGTNDFGQAPSDQACRKYGSVRAPQKNVHPTVKPVALMRYLCRMVTPQNGLVLDPFLGSGTTGIAALAEGFRFVGIERNDEYLAIAKARCGKVQRCLL